MKQFLTLIAILTSITVHCQYQNDYSPIQSKGNLPKDFVTQSSQKFLADKEELKGEKKAKKTKEDFLLASNFEIDNLILSGKVLFNDPLSEYVNKVAATVLASNPDLLNKIRFYILKSPVVNATSTNQGIIFINIGLLAQVENEAQLAYILCHEIEHYVLKHNITQAVENETIQKGKGNYKNLESKDDKFVAKCNFSKEQEAEADVKGYELFKKSKYSSENLINVFDVLKYSYLPFDEVDIDKTFFETEYYKIPSNFDLLKTKDINTSDEDDDEKSTHPSIKVRRQTLSKLLAVEDNSGKSIFLVGENSFEQARTIARFEQSRLYLLFHAYTKAIYNSYLLLKEFPSNKFLKKNIMFSLSGLAEYSANGDLREVQSSYKVIEGKSQKLYYLFEKLDSANNSYLSSMALAYAAKLATEFPDDQDIKLALETIAGSLKSKDKGLEYYIDEKTLDTLKMKQEPVAINGDNDTTNQMTVGNNKDTAITYSASTKSSKYQKIKDQELKAEKVEQTKNATYDFSQFAIVAHKKNKQIIDAFNSASNKKRKENNTESAYKKGRSNKTSEFLGIDKVVVLTPFYMKVIDQKKSNIKYLKGEAGQIDFCKRMVTNAERAKMNIELLNVRNLEEQDIEKLNDITFMQEYLRDRVNHSNNVDIPFQNRAQLLTLAKKYGTNKFMWSGVISFREDPSKTTKLAILTASVPFLLPFTLSPLINNGRWTLYFNLIYNVETDELVFSNYREINNRTADYILDQNIYDTFYQIKQKPIEHSK